jgi:CBS domain containing-hemolysin-like protein
MELLFFYLLLALGVSFLCSLLESVLLSITPSYATALEKKSARVGKLILKLKRDIDRPLAAILSLNTVAHTIGAAGVGAQALVVFGSGSVAVVSALLTLLILVLSEIIPKTLGAIYWRELAPVTARILSVMIVLLYPLVLLSVQLTRLMARRRKGYRVSWEELRAIVDLGIEEGLFREQESSIIKNLLQLRRLRAEDIMTPRTVMFRLPATLSVGEVIEGYPDIQFSRIPIFREDPNVMAAFVLKSDIYREASAGNPGKPLKALERDLPAVPEKALLVQLFERFLKNRQHAALVVDEHGDTAGILTMEDIIETLLGIEIVDETDQVADLRAAARRQWLKRARTMGLQKEDAEKF